VLRTDEPPPGTKFVEPIFEYDHTQGLSITGGFLYRGTDMPELRNAYIYGDWAWGRIWALKYDKGSKKVLSNDLLFKTELDAKSKQTLFQPTCFCEDANHEILTLDWNGRIFRLTPKTP
jgi:quinoprotein glucose dehydrogenase